MTQIKSSDIFERAIDVKLRFESPDSKVASGELTTEHVNGLSLNMINSMAIAVNNKLANSSGPVVSFLKSGNKVDKDTELNMLRLEILLHFIKKKEEKQQIAEKAASDREERIRRRELAIRVKSSKQASEFDTLSLEELDRIIQEG
jgi:hypothetical protein